MPELYMCDMSSPCRGAMLAAKCAGVELKYKYIDLMKGEHMTPEFIAINPQHTVPVLVDGDFKLWESRAIASYLASAYAKDDTLYPNSPKARAVVDQRLYFDSNVLFERFSSYAFPFMFGKVDKPDESKLQSIDEALGYLDKFLDGQDFVAGNKLTVADCCIASTVATMEAAGIALGKHSNVSNWLKRCKEQMPGYAEANAPGAKMFGDFFKSRLGQ